MFPLSRRALPAVLLATSLASLAQQAAPTEAVLQGTWISPGHPIDTALTFGSSQRLEVATRLSRTTPPKDFVQSQVPGAYLAGEAACSVGQLQGNLYVAHGSSRCCFQARLIGSTLVLDELRSASAMPQPPGGLCQSKTLAKSGAR